MTEIFKLFVLFLVTYPILQCFTNYEMDIWILCISDVKYT